MNKKSLLFAAAALALAVSAQAAVTRTSSPAAAIPDDSCTNLNGTGDGGATSTITFTETGTISDVNVAVEVAHTWRSDVQIGINYSVGGGAVQLYDDIGAGNDNVFVTFDSDSPTTCATACTAATPCSNTANAQTCSPSGSLNAYDGQTSPGTWTLSACDDSSAIAGTVNTWAVTLDGSGQLPIELMGFSIE